MTIDEAIKERQKVIEVQEKLYEEASTNESKEIIKSATDNDRQLAERLTELKEAKGIIRVCNRVLGYLLECEIESTSTRHEVETLLKNITEFLSGGSENG